MSRIKVGDKVRITTTSWGDKTVLKEIATVLIVKDNSTSILVEFSREINGGHDGKGFNKNSFPVGKNGYCWGFYNHQGDEFEKVGELKQLQLDF